MADTLGGMRMKLVALAGAALLLAGCSSQAVPTAEITPTFDDGGPNGVACRAFYTEWPKAFEVAGQSDQSEWDERAARIDSIALKADGDVKDRMLAFVNDWPDLFDLMMGDVDNINEHLSGIERACDAAGENIDGMQLVES